jgi:hypothetical protein
MWSCEKFRWQPHTFFLRNLFAAHPMFVVRCKSEAACIESLSERFFPGDDNRIDYFYAHKAMNFSLSDARCVHMAGYCGLSRQELLRRRYSWIRHLIEMLVCGWSFYWGIYLTLGRWFVRSLCRHGSNCSARMYRINFPFRIDSEVIRTKPLLELLNHLG